MVIDSSALLAIILQEPEAGRLVVAIAADQVRAVPAPAVVEVTAVLLTRKWSRGRAALDELLDELDADVVPMSADAAKHACSAYARFGKGAGLALRSGFRRLFVLRRRDGDGRALVVQGR